MNEFQEKWIVVEKFGGIAGVFIFNRDQEYAIKGTDAFYQGRIYLQSLSSMLPVLVLNPHKGETILDVCAAPWSKTTQMAAMMQNEGSITALEQNQIRYDKLMYNARLQGATIIEGKKVDARKFLETPLRKGDVTKWRGDWSFRSTHPQSSLHSDSSFPTELWDRILLDAPCSAEWRIDTRNEKSYGFWSIANIRDKSKLQYELLSLAVKNLKKWWTLVYSTCTLAPEENEWVISRIFHENPDLTLEPIDIWLSSKSWWREGMVAFGSQKYSEEMKKTVRILPSEETEGFFLAKIVKK
jgi:16S rRNA C967 or C1407 C5-methylase (RsmB/RsmF family)